MRDSLVLRKRIEREKSLKKYKEISLLPGGHPDYDVYDYSINEIVGMIRYGEMIHNRTMDIEVHDIDTDLAAELVDVAEQMQRFGRMVGTKLIELRERLTDRGFELGKPESRLDA